MPNKNNFDKIKSIELELESELRKHLEKNEIRMKKANDIALEAKSEAEKRIKS